VEDDNEGLARMTRRVEHITGLLAASNKDQSDRFMVIKMMQKFNFQRINQLFCIAVW